MQLGFVGGDARLSACAARAAEEGHRTYFYTEGSPLDELLSLVDLLVLPVPLTKDGSFISGTRLPLKSLESVSVPMLGGFVPAPLASRVYDIAAEEDFTLKNAALTAEGGIAGALSATGRSFYNLSVGVIGYGRIARLLLGRLASFGAPLTVYARKSDARTDASLRGIRAVSLEEDTVFTEEVIFSTVPAPVFGRNAVSRAIYVCDLGGGMPRALPRTSGGEVEVTSYRGVPGVFAPLAAGDIIYESLRAYIGRLGDR